MRRPCLLLGTLLALRVTFPVAVAVAAPAGPSSPEGFRLEPRPILGLGHAGADFLIEFV